MHPLAHAPTTSPPDRRGTGAALPLLGLALILVAAAAVAGVLVARHSRAVADPAGTKPCGLSAVDPAMHLALVGAAGGGRSAYVIPGRDADRTGEVELLVTARAAPVFLVLFGDEPLIWRLGLAPGVEIVGVIVAARHPQVVVGLPEGSPVQRYTGPGMGEACRARFAQAILALGPARDGADSVQFAGPIDGAEAMRAVVGAPAGTPAALRHLPTDAAVARLVPHREAGAG